MSIILYQIFLAVGSEDITPIEVGYVVLFATTFSGWLIKCSVLKRFPIPRTSLIPPIAFFLAYCGSSIVFAKLRGIPVLHWLRQWQAFVSLLLVLPIITEFTDGRRLRFLVSAVILSGAIIAGWGICSNFVREDIIRFGPTGIISTTRIWTTLLIIGLLGYLKQRRWRLILWMLLVVNLFRFVIDVRRIPMVILLLGLSIILWFTFIQTRANAEAKIRYFTAFFGIVVLGVLISLWTPNSLLTLSGLHIERWSAQPVEMGLVNRYLQIKATLLDFTENPLIGQGFGYSFDKPILVSMPGRGVYEIGRVHNLYTYLLSHSGLVGLGLYLWFLGALLKEGTFVVSNVNRDFEKGLAVGLLSGCVSIAVFGMFSALASRIEVQSFLALAGGIFIVVKERIGKGELTEE